MRNAVARITYKKNTVLRTFLGGFVEIRQLLPVIRHDSDATLVIRTL